MLGFEDEFYDFKDILCLLMDMFGIIKPHFTLEIL